MTKRSRTFLFFSLVAIFLVAAPGIILYSQGFRFNWESKGFTQVGAFFFDVHPPRAQIFIDGERVGETSRFIGNALSKNLLSKTYRVAIEKDGYIPWQKTLEIFPRQVTEAKNITLFPANLILEPIQKNVLTFWPAPNKRHILLQRQLPGQAWTLVLWDTEAETEHLLFEAQSLDDTVWNIIWAPDSNAFLLHVASGETVEAFLQTIDHSMLGNASSSSDIAQIASDLRTPLPFFQNRTKQVHFMPPDNDRLLFLSASNPASFLLSVLNTTSLELEQPIARNVVSFAVFENQIFWIDEQGLVWQRSASSSEDPIQLLTEPFLLDAEEFHQLHAFANQVFLETRNTLYWLDDTTRTFRQFSSHPKEVRLSPDGKKIAVSNGQEIVLLFIDDNAEQPARKKGDAILLTRLSEQISNLAWVNSNYLLFSAADAIYTAEIDVRDHAQVVSLVETAHTKFFWQPSQEQLYLFGDTTIQSTPTFWP